MSKTVLLIGGAGYIGTVVASEFLSKGYKVKCYDSLIYNQKDCLKKLLSDKNFEFIKEDLRNESQNKIILKDAVNIVLLAGLVGDPITKKYPKISKEINLNSTKKFISQCKKAKNLKKLIFVSTCSNYGISKRGKISSERSKLNPLSSYAKYKVMIEKYILSLKNQVNFSSCILRFATAFGVSERMRFDLTVNHFVHSILNKQELEIYDKNTWRPYCHVKDFARLILKVLKTDQKKIHFQVFNAGSDKNNFTKKKILNEIIKILPYKKIKFKKGDVDKRDYRVSFKKVKKILKFQAKYSVKYGIKEIINSYKKKNK